MRGDAQMNAQSQLNWTERAESFARIRAQLRQILVQSHKPLDYAQIATKFKLQFRYLPNIERRLRELVQSGDVRRNGGAIPSTIKAVRFHK